MHSNIISYTSYILPSSLMFCEFLLILCFIFYFIIVSVMYTLPSSQQWVFRITWQYIWRIAFCFFFCIFLFCKLCCLLLHHVLAVFWVYLVIILPPHQLFISHWLILEFSVPLHYITLVTRLCLYDTVCWIVLNVFTMHSSSAILCCDAAQNPGISFVRVGNATSIHDDVKRHSLSEMAKERFRRCTLC